jgi:hypothetical protein
MERVIRFKLYLVGIILFGFLLIFFLGDYSNPRREIYFRHNSKVDAGYLFGYIPSRYQDIYKEEVLIDSSDYRLINITYLRYPSENHNYVLLEEKENSESEEILFDSDAIYSVLKGTDDLLSSQINLAVFNNYLKNIEISSKREIIEHFCGFFVDFQLDNFMRVENAFQISQLQKVKVLTSEETDDCYILLQEGFIPDFETYTYLWFENLGLFEVSFFANDQLVRSINDKFIFGPLSLNVVGTEPCPTRPRCAVKR